MKKWVRWQGLILFAIILLLICGFWFFLADLLVKRLIERTGTQMVGAKVELDKANLSLFPLGLTLQRLQVTNPDEPMRNAVEVARLACQLDGLNLLRRKIIIEEMGLEGVRLGTPRTHSGAISQTEKKEARGKKPAMKLPSIEFPSFDLPSVEKILQKEELKTLKLAESFQKEMAAEKENWQKRVAELPDQKNVDDYRNRLAKIQSATKGGIGGIAGGLGDALALQQEIEKDIDRIREMQEELTGKMSSWKDQAAKLEKAPLEDIQRLKNKYSPSGTNIGNFTRLLLEGKTQDWIETALFWWEKLNPVLERTKERKGKVEIVQPIRGKGVDVRYPETQPWPEFLIRLLKVSLALDMGDMTGRVEDITTDPDILGRPLKFSFSGEKMKLASLVKVEGVIDRVSPARASDKFKALIQGYQIKDMNLSSIPNLPLQLTGGIANLDLTGELRKETIDADLKVTLNSTQLELPKKEGANPVMSAVSSALSDISNFSIKAKVNGPLENYRLEVSSDLTDQVRNALQSQLRKFTSQFEGELSSAVLAKVGPPLQGAKSGLGGMDGIQKELEKRLQQLTGLQSKKGPQQTLPGGFRLPPGR